MGVVCFKAMCSKGWCGWSVSFLRAVLAMYATVSLAAQKNDALSINPIGRLRWKPMRGSRSDGWGIEKASFGISSILSHMGMFA